MTPWVAARRVGASRMMQGCMCGKCLSLWDASRAQSRTLRGCSEIKNVWVFFFLHRIKKCWADKTHQSVSGPAAFPSRSEMSALRTLETGIHLQQRALWMFSIYSSWLRFLKGIRGFPRKPCSVFRGGRPIFSHTPLTRNCSCESSPPYWAKGWWLWPTVDGFCDVFWVVYLFFFFFSSEGDLAIAWCQLCKICLVGVCHGQLRTHISSL